MWGDQNITDKIKGRVIKSVDHGNSSLMITFEDGTEVTGTTEGDCCSSSWIEHMTIPPDIAGATVYSVEDSEPVIGEDEGKDISEWEDIKYYATAIKTDHGEIIIEYRNSSNGYYGGWIEWNFIN